MEGAAKKSILVVDDEPLIRETLEFGLQKDFSVRLAGSGREAIEAAKQESFPVVILDLRMNDLGGLDTLRELRKIDQEQKIIILTAHQSMESAIEAVNLGAFNYLTKPCDLVYLRELVSKAHRLYFEEKVRADKFRNSAGSIHDEVLSLLCHEFNTPLNGIIGFSGLLADDIKSSEHREMAEYIERSGKNLHSIFMEMVDYLSSNRPKGPSRESRFSVRSLEEWLTSSDFENQCSVFFSGCEEKAIRTYNGSFRTLKMVLSKIGQAAKLPTDDELSIVIWIRNENGKDTLHLQIQGDGLNELLRIAGSPEAIFSPYASSRLNLTGNSLGLGLPLATCRNLAESADIGISCQADDKNRVRILLNLAIQPESEIPDDPI